MLSKRVGYIISGFLVAMGLVYIVDSTVLSYIGYDILFIPLLLGILTGSVMADLFVKWN